MKTPAPSLERALELARETRAVGVRRDGKGRVLFTYLYPSPELFALPEGRELRGIVYREDGSLLSRPFYKFFHYEEPPWGLKREEFTGPVLLGEKLDGYLLQVFLDGEELVLASRHSLNPPLVGKVASRLWGEEVEREARAFLSEVPATLLFEVIDPEVPVLVRYPKPRLALICARDLDTGAYLFPERDFPWKGERVRWEERQLDPGAFHEEVARLEGLEGFVAYLPERGEFVKFKANWAFRLAEFLKDPAGRFLQAYVQDTVDDLLGALGGREDLGRAVLEARKRLDGVYLEAVELGNSLRELPRKEAWERAVEEARKHGTLAPAFAEAAMGAFGGGEPRKKFLFALERGGRGRAFLEGLSLFPRVGEARE